MAKLQIAKRKGDGWEFVWLDEVDVPFSEYARITAFVVGDANGDGRSDIVVASSGHPNQGLPGKVVTVSGGTGRSLHTFTDHGDEVETFGCGGPEYWGCSFGISAASAGDLDNDGCDEVLIGSPMVEYSEGAVILFNLRTQVAQKIIGPREARYGRFGYKVMNAIDYDADGVSDYVIGESWFNNINRSGAEFYIISGRSHNVLRRFPPEAQK